MTERKKNIIYRITLTVLLFFSFLLNGYAFGMLTKYQPEDFIFSCVVISVLCLFALFELVMNFIKFSKTPSLEKITYTERGYFNVIPFIAVSLGMLIALGLTITGTVLFFIKEDISIKCNSLVVLTVGFYLLLNCVVYYLYVLMNKKTSK